MSACIGLHALPFWYYILQTGITLAFYREAVRKNISFSWTCAACIVDILSLLLAETAENTPRAIPSSPRPSLWNLAASDPVHDGELQQTLVTRRPVSHIMAFCIGWNFWFVLFAYFFNNRCAESSPTSVTLQSAVTPNITPEPVEVSDFMDNISFQSVEEVDDVSLPDLTQWAMTLPKMAISTHRQQGW